MHDEVQARSGAAIAAASLVLAAVAALASAIPAVRASRIDPAQALRDA